MRTALIYLFIGLAFHLSLPLNMSAQVDIVVNEIQAYMSRGEKTGFQVAIPDMEPKAVESAWKKYMKKHSAKAKSSKKSVEMFADNARIPEVSDNTVDIYSIARKASYGTEFSVFVDLGGAFISSNYHEIAFGGFQKHMREFTLSMIEEGVSDELKEQEKVLKTLEKELDNLVKEKDKHLKEIEKAKKIIAENESEIINNESARDIIRQKIALQEEIVRTIEQKHSIFKTR